MKTHFLKKTLAGALFASMFLNVNFDVMGQTWNIPTNANATTPNTSYFGMTTSNDLVIQNTSSTNDIVFKTNSTEYMRLIGASTNRGNLGIGTTTPLSPLQIGNNENKVSCGLGYWGPYIGFNAAWSGGNWNIYAANDDGDHGGAAIMTDETGSMLFCVKSVGGQAANQTVTNSDFTLTNQKIRIDAGTGQVDFSGNIQTPGTISIGTIASHPSGYKLFVDDGIITEKIKVATQTWSDFVFDKSYKLMPLTQVEKFIDKNKHLPDVPCEKEMIENGLDVATMDAKLLQKIEELTLYMIELEKKNRILEDRLIQVEKKQLKDSNVK